jgi:hypothetical protein
MSRVTSGLAPFPVSFLFPCPFAKSLRGAARRIESEVIDYGGCNISIESSVGAIPTLKDVTIGKSRPQEFEQIIIDL